ncbi:hypothetical protein AB0M88_17880, partial [Actinoplanes sp. NPDC051411]
MTLPPLKLPARARAVDDPAWARAITTEVLGSGWPSGDEVAVWDVADRWYALADALTGPRTSAFAAADQIVAGLLGAGIAPDGFRDAWEKLSGDEDAPLNALVQIAAELGQMVEECGREIEAAKLAALIEVGTVLTELADLSIAIELTLGAAGLAAEALIAASRVAVEQIYARLGTRLGGEPVTRPPTADPAHSAKSDQRTVRLTLPGAGGRDSLPPAADDVRPGAAAGRHATSRASAIADDAAASGAAPSRATPSRATPSRATASGTTTSRAAIGDGTPRPAAPSRSAASGAPASSMTPGAVTGGATPGAVTGGATPGAVTGGATPGA